MHYDNMSWSKQDMLYSIPDEIGSFGDCALNSSLSQCLNQHLNRDNFKHIPNTLTSLITTYTNELYGCINGFETKYKEMRHVFKFKIYSCVIVEGVECFYEEFD